jgi:hypothetical protein
MDFPGSVADFQRLFWISGVRRKSLEIVMTFPEFASDP